MVGWVGLLHILINMVSFRTGWITLYPCVSDICMDGWTGWIAPYPGVSDIYMDGRTGWIVP